MKRAWNWVKKNVGAVLGMLLTAILAIFGGGWLWRRAHPRQDEILAGEKELAKLDGIREEMLKRVDEKDEAIEHIDEQRRAKVKEIAIVRAGVEDLNDDEVEAEFRRLYGD